MTTLSVAPATALEQLLAFQDGVVAQMQVAPSEWRRAQRHVRASRWQRPTVGVVVAHNGPLTPVQKEWIALLAAGPGAVLCGLTAAASFGLRGFPVEQVHVLTDYLRSSARTVPWARLHRTRLPYAGDVHAALAPPRVRAPVAIAQSAAWAATPRYGCAVLAAGVQQRVVRAADVRSCLVRLPRVRDRLLFLRVIDDIAGGAQALAEIDATRRCAEAGLPAPTRQRLRDDRDGRRRYLDLDWEQWRLAAEIDGRQHMEFVRWQDDLDRQNEVVIPGDRTVLRFSSITVRTRPQRFTDQIRRALIARGWR
jgi:hypothetical protein